MVPTWLSVVFVSSTRRSLSKMGIGSSLGSGDRRGADSAYFSECSGFLECFLKRFLECFFGGCHGSLFIG